LAQACAVLISVGVRWLDLRHAGDLGV